MQSRLERLELGHNRQDIMARFSSRKASMPGIAFSFGKQTVSEDHVLREPNPTFTFHRSDNSILLDAVGHDNGTPLREIVPRTQFSESQDLDRSGFRNSFPNREFSGSIPRLQLYPSCAK